MIIGTARHAADLLEPLFAGAGREKVVVLHLDGDGRVMALDQQEVAHESEAELPMRAILRAALERESAGILIAHNHPSGDPRPSNADIVATRQLAEIVRALGIRLHDHLIFADGDCRSFRALGLL